MLNEKGNRNTVEIHELDITALFLRKDVFFSFFAVEHDMWMTPTIRILKLPNMYAHIYIMYVNFVLNSQLNLSISKNIWIMNAWLYLIN